MSDKHGIEELTRQFEQAKGRLDAATQSFSEVRLRLGEAYGDKLLEELAERGITPGTIVTDGEKKWGFMGTEPAESWMISTNASMVLRKLHKDGSIGAWRLRPHLLRPQNIRPVETDT